jgi:TolB-like protein/Tfp pilus assembly protein PilF
VLNFRLLSRDSSDAYLAEGLADAITTRLSQVERLDVASRTAARLGRTPRAAYVVSGTMLRQNARLVVNVELARASTGRNAWAQRYERPDTAVLQLESDISLAVASTMLTSVTPAERTALGGSPTSRADAYDHLMRGNFLLVRRSLTNVTRAIQEYEAAARLDPTLAAAQARIGLACALWQDYGWDPGGRPAPDSVLAKGLAATARALAIDSNSSDAWLSKAYLGIWANPRTFEGVEEAFRRSIALDPRSAEAHSQYGDFLSIVRREHESDEELRTALRLDPARPVTLRNLGSNLGAEGLPQLDSALQIEPDVWIGYLARALVRAQDAHDTAGARADAERGRRLAPPETELFSAALAGDVYLTMGDTAAALRELQRALELVAPTGPLANRTMALGQLLYRLGRIDEALDQLERATPRGANLWFGIMDRNTDLTAVPPRARRVLEEARPPWVH